MLKTFEEMDEMFHYDEDTGLLIRKKRSAQCVNVGDIAGCKRSDGYIVISVHGRQYKAHRIVWLLKTGRWPSGQIDHIDHDRSNNRFHNLRDTDYSGNRKNHGLSSQNTSGTTGVSLHPKTKRWRSQIYDANGLKHIGYFNNIDDAIAARKAAEIELGYHKNHGKNRI